MNISICNACRSADVDGSIRLFDTDAVKSLVSSEYPDAKISIRRTESEDDEECVVASIAGRVVTASDEKELRAIEARASRIIREYESSMRK
jgi:hypothetical protein